MIIKQNLTLPLFVAGATEVSRRAPSMGARSIPYRNMSTTYEKVAGNNSLQWILMCPWARKQLSHFRIPKEPDKLLN